MVVFKHLHKGKIIPVEHTLKSGLENFSGFLRSFDHRNTFVDSAGHRFLAKHMQSCRKSIQNYRCVLVQRCSHNNGIQFFQFQHLPVIGIGICLSLHDVRTQLKVRRVIIENGNYLDGRNA